jgi:hypothetical protein
MALPLTETEHAILMIANILTLGGMFIWALWQLEQPKQKPKIRFSWRDYTGTSSRPADQFPANQFCPEPKHGAENQMTKSEP